VSQIPRGPFRFVTSGVEQSLRTLDEFGGLVDEFADQLMEDFARKVYDRSQVLVPVRDPNVTPPKDIAGGSLKQSGAVFRGDNPGEWIVGYGGTSAPRDAFYAVYVHEMPYHHEPPTQWKYLSTAVDEALPTFHSELSATFEAVFSGVGQAGQHYVPIRGDLRRYGRTVEEIRLRPTPSTLIGEQ
jgi:hypothetical protein